LLALRHSSGAQPARRFERFVALSRSELAKEEGFFRRPQPRSRIDIEAAIDRPRRGRRWEPDLPMLLQTYLSIAQRGSAGRAARRPAGPGDNYGFYRSMNSASAQNGRMIAGRAASVGKIALEARTARFGVAAVSLGWPTPVLAL
jgi:hypothetical protein